MNLTPAARAVSREARNLGVILEPVSSSSDGQTTYGRSAVRQLLGNVTRRSPKSVDAGNLVHTLNRALTAPSPSDRTEEPVLFSEITLRTVAQQLERLNAALSRVQKIRRGIIPGRLSAPEANQILLQRLGIRR